MYACPSYLLCYLNVVRNRRILSLIVFCRGAPSIKNRVPLQNGKRTGKQGKAVPTLLLANLRTLPASHLASKVAWSHFALVGEICPQAPLNDFAKSAAHLRSFLRLRRVRESRRYVNMSLTCSLFLGILETEKEVTQP